MLSNVQKDNNVVLKRLIPVATLKSELWTGVAVGFMRRLTSDKCLCGHAHVI